MSNYVKTVNFAAKDALAHLNPAKVAKGTEIDTELNNIATAIATKEETTNKNAANGYAGLDATSKLLKANQYANTAYLDSTNAFTLATTFAGTSTFNAGVTINSTLGVTGAVSFTTVLGVTSGGTGTNASTGSGNVVLQTSPALVTPALGTPVSGNLANCTFPTLNQSTTGNANTATNVAASGITGTTLASNVTASSLTSFGTSIALGTPASGNLANCTFPTLNQNTTGSAGSVAASAITGTTLASGVTGSSLTSFGTSPSFTTPVLGTPTSGNLTNCTADGTVKVGFINIPRSTTTTTIATTDNGKCISASGNLAVPNSTFSAGDAVSIFNNTAASINITAAAGTQYKAGTNANQASIALASRGTALIWFDSSTVWVVSGNVT